MGPMTAKNTLPLAPGTERGAWRFNRGSLGVDPATARLGPSLFLSRRSGHNLGPASMALRRPAASSRTRCVSRRMLGFWLGSRWHGLGRLGSRRKSGKTRASCRAKALWQEVSHCLGRLLCRSEAPCDHFHSGSGQASGGDW